MNFKNKLSIIFFFSLLLLPFISYFIIPSNIKMSLAQFNIVDTPKSSGHWILPYTIHVDNNWSATESYYDWCSGSGTIGIPYIIENVTIDCEGVRSGIHIENSNVYFTIQNCTIMNAKASGGYAAIKLHYVKNGTIFNNNISNNYVGMNLYHCENITISENIIFDNIGQGIILYQSKYNYIINNAQKGSRYYGLFLEGLSDNNVITGNNFTENTFEDANGIFIINSNENNVTRNLLKDNDRGVYIEDNSNENKIINNTIHDNAEYGILILKNTRMCVNNTLYANNIDNPLGTNAYDNGVNTQWDYLGQGNYWGDYSGVDDDDNGIGDSPYYFSGTGTAHDDFPIWDDGLNPLPVIILNSPAERTFGTTAPTINITISDNDLSTAWYTLNSSATKFDLKPNYGINIITINQSAWSALDEGTVTITIFAIDSKGQIGNLSVLFTKEIPSASPEIPFGNYYIVFMGISILFLLGIVSRKRKLINS